jgi:hypothetical protein
MRNYKLINNRPKEIKYIPLESGGGITNPNEEQLIDFGCKEWIRPEPQANCEEIFTENETQIISTWVEIPKIIEPWHEETNFQIKFRPMDLLELLKNHKAMIEYTDTLTQYTDMMENVYYYVNFFNEMERELIEYYGGIVNEKN